MPMWPSASARRGPTPLRNWTGRSRSVKVTPPRTPLVGPSRASLEDSGDEALRVERLEVVHPLPRAHPLHRQSHLLLERDHDPAARRAVELGEQDAGEADRLLEGAHLVERVLPDGRVEHD